MFLPRYLHSDRSSLLAALSKLQALCARGQDVVLHHGHGSADILLDPLQCLDARARFVDPRRALALSPLHSRLSPSSFAAAAGPDEGTADDTQRATSHVSIQHASYRFHFAAVPSKPQTQLHPKPPETPTRLVGTCGLLLHHPFQRFDPLREGLLSLANAVRGSG